MYLDLKLTRPCKPVDLFPFFTKKIMIQVTEQTKEGITAVRLSLPLTQAEEEELMRELTLY